MNLIKSPYEMLLERLGLSPTQQALTPADMQAQMIAGGQTPPNLQQQPQGLKEGHQPKVEMGQAYAYEPSYNERIRDFLAPHIGRAAADRLFGGPSAQKIDEYSPLGMLAQIPGNGQELCFYP